MYRNMQRSYVEFQRFAEQAQLTSPQSERSHTDSRCAADIAAIIPALPLATTSATTDEEGKLGL
jgi:hypothetical protein